MASRYAYHFIMNDIITAVSLNKLSKLVLQWTVMLLTLVEKVDRQTEILISVFEHGVDHSCDHVIFLPVIPQLTQPFKIVLRRDVMVTHLSQHITTVYIEYNQGLTKNK